MTSTTAITAKLRDLSTRGFVVAVTPSGSLQVRPASAITPDDRAWLRENAAAVVEHLRGAAEIWDAVAANKLASSADSLLEQLGVSGTHPQVQAPAERVVAASGDMAAFRRAIAEYEAAVKRVAAERTCQRPAA